MNTPTIPGFHAWESVIKSHRSRWSDDIARFNDGLCAVAHEPKFTFEPSTPFFCIGSCFARNVEEHLIYAGQRVLSRRIICPKAEWSRGVNGLVNKFTTHSMTNELVAVRELPPIDETCFVETSQGWIDLQLCPAVRPVTLERAIQRRNYLTSEYFNRARQADVVILTLGLNEVWFDNYTDRYLNAAPSLTIVSRNPGRYVVEITDAEANLEQLKTIRSTLKKLNPSIRLIVTVSPVPLGETFSGRDVAVANMYSKSVLRVAAEQFAERYNDVDYFPSFDMVSLSPRASAYGPDCLHVADEAVGEIIREFLKLYTGREITAAPFNELAYLAANPDVEEAVRRGELESGFQHWQLYGQAENRILEASN